MSQRTLVITEAQAGRIDIALAAAFPQVGRRRLAELFASGAVRVGGRVARKGDRVAVVELSSIPPGRGDERPQPDAAAFARLRILLERPDLVAVDKPAPMPSQPLRAGELGSAACGIAFRFPECAVIGDDPRDGGLVHRLDTGTTGVLLAARTVAAYRQLREAFAAGQVIKTYLAITCGRPVGSACSSSLSQRGRRVVVDEQEGLAAHTDVEVLASHGNLSLVRCTAQTGRMHQVRAHLAVLRAPILGDALYGAPPMPTLVDVLPADRFMLHGESVALVLGTEKGIGKGAEKLKIASPLPEEALAILAAGGLPFP
jgi:23S rRNA pseudouridine1911/1915/1917 synthase